METALVAAPAQVFLAELHEEVPQTRRVFERAPVAQLDWQPHAKSMRLGQLLRHTADVLGWIKDTLESTDLDVAVFDNAPATPIGSTAELLAYLEERAAAATAGLQAATADDLEQIWTMRSGEQVLVRQSRASVVRHLISQMIHHRGQLTVYLRLLDVPVPGPYGPSADEQNWPS
ncbi:hypothetical protein GCM10027048_05740 [Hymenobacter coalescens]